MNTPRCKRDGIVPPCQPRVRHRGKLAGIQLLDSGLKPTGTCFAAMTPQAAANITLSDYQKIDNACLHPHSQDMRTSTSQARHTLIILQSHHKDYAPTKRVRSYLKQKGDRQDSPSPVDLGLFKEEHLAGRGEISCSDDIEVNTACKTICVEVHDVVPGTLRLAHEGSDFLAQDVVHIQLYILDLRKSILDNRSWIERIWIVLREREFSRNFVRLANDRI